MRNRIFVGLTWLFLATLLGACASNAGLNPAESSGSALPPKVGVVESVKAIDLPGEQGASGYFLGGTLGNIGGAVLGGGGRGSVAASVLGGVAGAKAGDSAQNNGVVAGQEIWVKIEDKLEPLVISQPIKLRGMFQVGEHVRVIRGARGFPVIEHEVATETVTPK
ncbi:hypothetical protein OYT1_ch0013 [Ferriphaselus amnicola]|uniref:Outer membrane lipoprotein pcp n=1 Tax=Ferriphaselus amnicola TaxID=1188319 RepID=A0A2Z6G807_9PROT|nr:hypothetical protein [Ferriphaselus amnicola]BBE49590.1 hypothetical protein OYT1_ch0013 [Ferriphaselus amnicola]